MYIAHLRHAAKPPPYSVSSAISTSSSCLCHKFFLSWHKNIRQLAITFFRKQIKLASHTFVQQPQSDLEARAGAFAPPNAL